MPMQIRAHLLIPSAVYVHVAIVSSTKAICLRQTRSGRRIDDSHTRLMSYSKTKLQKTVWTPLNREVLTLAKVSSDAFKTLLTKRGVPISAWGPLLFPTTFITTIATITGGTLYIIAVRPSHVTH